jgi:NAD(P)-dependent dehydrogenase (short-subunit alcohol dehydrogenase family)
MAEKVALVTGGTGAIGRAVAAGLAQQGAAVVMVGRNAERGAAAAEEIRRETGGAAEFIQADLAALGSVRETAMRCLTRFGALDILVNNAALFTRRRTLTVDGLEVMFAANHLGHLLTTNLLLPALQARGEARVLNVTAPSTVPLDFDDLQSSRRFNPLRAFGASKMANLLFTFELARRLEGTGVTVNAVHPGLVRSTLMREAPAPLRWVTSLISSSPERAARPIGDLATAPQYAGKTGRFYYRGREIEPPAYARDPAAQQRLWQESARLAGLGG